MSIKSMLIDLYNEAKDNELTEEEFADEMADVLKEVENEAITGALAESSWQKDGDNIYYEDGKVGIGTDNPLEELHVNDDVLVSKDNPARDSILLSGRTGGTASRRVTLRPEALSANRTQTLQNYAGTIPVVYSGSVQNQTLLPIGHTVLVQTGSNIFNRNSNTTIRISGQASYSTSGSGAILSGTWRARGQMAAFSSSARLHLFQRTV